MIFTILVVILIVSVLIYMIYTSYSFQVLYHKFKINRGHVDDFVSEVRGILIGDGHFTASQRAISVEEFKEVTGSRKKNYTRCYNLVTFKTADAEWELFYYLVKEGILFKEMMCLKVFPMNKKIRSEANVERNYSRLNILTNNRYLTNVLEESDSRNTLNWLLKRTGDSLLMTHREMIFKTISEDVKETHNSKSVLDMIKSLNIMKNKVYKSGVMEY